MPKLIKKYWWFLILVALSGYFFFSKLQNTTINDRFKNFAIRDINEISTISINYDTISFFLSKVENGWLVNNSQLARPDAVEAMLFLLSRIEATSPLPVSVADSLIDLLNSKGLQVKIGNQKRVIREYRVFSTSTLGLGGIGILKGSKYAFRLGVPNYNDNIVELFFTNPSMWIENSINIAGIKKVMAVEVEIPEEPEKSFRIDSDENEENRLIDLFYGKPAKSFDNDRVNRYLSSIQNITLTRIEKQLTSEEIGAILYSQPDFIITLYYDGAAKQEVRFYPIPVDEYIDEFGRAIRFDLNRLNVLLNNDNSTIYETKYLDIHPILKDISFFNPKFD